MRHRHGLLLSAFLLLVTGCGTSTATTTETSMMRGPTPSSGMTIPRLLTASAPPNFSSSADSGFDTQDSALADPPDDSSVADPTDEIAPPESGGADLLPSGIPGEIPSDDGQLPPGGQLEPGTVVDLAAIATNIGCAEYLDQPPLPLTTGAGKCSLAGESVQLYSFATDEDQGTFIQQLVGQGVSVDSLVQGELFIVIPGPTQLATVSAALTPG
jgi:hypothetical protein